MTRMLVVASPTVDVLCTDSPLPTDGEYPHHVAVWRERTAAWCPGCGCVLPAEENLQPCWSCGTYVPEAAGAVVATVEVTGPGHHADDCLTETGPEWSELRLCHPDAAPEGWHTPVGKVTRLDTPVPCERPEEGVVVRVHDDGGGYDIAPAVWWAPTKETDDE